jgi:hypothetical protein
VSRAWIPLGLTCGGRIRIRHCGLYLSGPSCFWVDIRRTSAETYLPNSLRSDRARRNGHQQTPGEHDPATNLCTYVQVQYEYSISMVGPSDQVEGKRSFTAFKQR